MDSDPSHPPDDATRGGRSILRILDAAARMFGRDGYQQATMQDVATAAGVSKGLLHYHFRSKEHLLIETLRLTFRRIYARVEERFVRGERGMPTALHTIDALWEAMRDLHAWTPFMVETMSLSNQDGPVRADLEAFYQEAEDLLVRGIRDTFAADGTRLRVPPDRLARLVRTVMHGLVVELARARTPEDVARVDQTYQDVRQFFEESVLREGP